MFTAFGPEKRMQLYDRGIRRRLAPMLHNDRKQLELASARPTTSSTDPTWISPASAQSS